MKTFCKGCVLLLFLSLATTVDARMRRVSPGEVPELRPGQGLVLVAIDTPFPLHSARLARDGRLLSAGALRDVEPGTHYQLFVASPGTYQWREVRPLWGVIFPLGKDRELSFEVAPGRVNYPGDLVFRPRAVWRADINSHNRALAAMDWLRREHPGIDARYRLEYSGRSVDPFPSFYREALAQSSARDSFPDARDALVAPPEAGELPLPLDTIFRDSRVVRARMNPGGTRLAVHVHDGGDDWAIELIDLRSGALQVIATSVVRFDQFAWSGDDRLVLMARPAPRVPIVTVVHIQEGPDGALAVTGTRVPRRGTLVHPLPAEPDQILFASRTSTGGIMMVHRVDISSPAAIEAFRPTLQTRLNAGLRNDVAWLADIEGRIRSAVVAKEDEYVLVHGGDGRFEEVLSLTNARDFQPVAISADANVIYGLTDKDREQTELVAFDVASRRVTETLFSRPGADVETPLFDDQRRLAGVAYYRQGRFVSEYFGEADIALEARLRESLPDRTVVMVERSSDLQQAMVWVDAGDQPPALYHLDLAKGSASPVAETMPWLAGVPLTPTRLVPVQAFDGTALDAFLTLPDATGPRPLIVFPHGGPIGVADRLRFDREVQFLASLGYAVLQVNFRGSGGYGRAFREAGYRNWGRLIEDDIDAALQHVLANHPLDASRICVLGASYGGYSALIAAARWPERFRCAVSMVGVTDLPLMMTSSDASANPDRRRRLVEIMGDPDVDLDDMLAHSPLYRYRDLKVPVMLVHGLEDHRVDFEHSRRLQRMLALDGRPPVGMVFADEGHSFTEIENLRAQWRGIAGFLQAHLSDADPATAQAPELPAVQPVAR